MSTFKLYETAYFWRLNNYCCWNWFIAQLYHLCFCFMFVLTVWNDCEIIILMFKRRFFVYCWFFCLLSCYSSVLLERSQNPDYKKRKPFFSSLSNQSLPSKILCGNTVNGCSQYGGSQWFVNFHLYLDLCHQFLFILIFLGDAVSKWIWLISQGHCSSYHEVAWRILCLNSLFISIWNPNFKLLCN